MCSRHMVYHWFGRILDALGFGIDAMWGEIKYYLLYLNNICFIQIPVTGWSLWSQKLFHWRLCRSYCLCFRNKIGVKSIYISHQSVLSFCVTLARHNFSQSDSAGHGDRGGRMLMFGLQRPQFWVYFWEIRRISWVISGLAGCAVWCKDPTQVPAVSAHTCGMSIAHC